MTTPGSTDTVAISTQFAQHMLILEHGPILGGPTLWRLLGYRSADAFRKAAQRKTLPVATFTIPHRRGRFAQTAHVILWLDRVASSPSFTMTGKEV